MTRLRFESSERDIEELWSIWLGVPCCEDCKRGDTADCDVNPLRMEMAPGRAATALTRLRRAP
jgi:hypothetical protein